MKSKRRILVGFLAYLCFLCIGSGQNLRPIHTDSLSPSELEQDLDQFQRELEERFAYLKANHADYESAIAAIRKKATNGMTKDEFGMELTKVLGLFIDCHASISGFSFPKGYLPFRIEPIGNRYVAFWSDRSNFLNPAAPYITKINGISIDDWCVMLRPFIPKGSPQYVKTRALRLLNNIRFACTLAGLKRWYYEFLVEVELEYWNHDQGSTTYPMDYPFVEISDQYPYLAEWPNSPSRIMEGNIGYLRIRSWDKDAFDEIAIWMPRFLDTQRLIIDIRDNRGGTRNVLRELYPYLVTEHDKPRVAGASKYRLYDGFGPGWLDSRHMYPENWIGWTSAENTAISEFMQTFEPQWNVPEDEFSGWHFWVLSKQSKPDAVFYPHPVLILMDRNCFSASDVILSSLKGMPNITLMGVPSGGGSGAAVTTILENSQLRLRLSSMASFQGTGMLFDGCGIEPDIELEPIPEYFLQNGQDNVLETAARISEEEIRKEKGKKSSKIRR